MPYPIRLATLADVTIIIRFRRCMFAEMGYTPYTEAVGMDAAYRAWLEPRLERGDHIGWLALDEHERPVGSVGVELLYSAPHPVDLSTRRGHLVNVWIEPAHRRRGLARQLTQTAMDWCMGQGIRVMTLSASDAGRPLYESLGFKASSEMVCVLEELL